MIDDLTDIEINRKKTLGPWKVEVHR